jgi:hypothetical protein
MLLLPVYFPVYPSHLAILFPAVLVVKNHTIIFSVAKLFGFDDRGKRDCKGTHQHAGRWSLNLNHFHHPLDIFCCLVTAVSFPDIKDAIY